MISNLFKAAYKLNQKLANESDFDDLEEAWFKGPEAKIDLAPEAYPKFNIGDQVKLVQTNRRPFTVLGVSWHPRRLTYIYQWWDSNTKTNRTVPEDYLVLVKARKEKTPLPTNKSYRKIRAI